MRGGIFSYFAIVPVVDDRCKRNHMPLRAGSALPTSATVAICRASVSLWTAVKKSCAKVLRCRVRQPAREPVKIQRRKILPAVATDISVALVVGEEDDDVRRRRGGEERRGEGEQQREEQRELGFHEMVWRWSAGAGSRPAARAATVAQFSPFCTAVASGARHRFRTHGRRSRFGAASRARKRRRRCALPAQYKSWA